MGLKEHFAAARGEKPESTGYAPIVGTVTRSMEFDRIKALPRRVLDLDDVQDVTPLFATSGLHSFWPIQSASLIEAAYANGFIGLIGVGFGKTLICLAMPEALDSKKTVLLVPGSLKRQLLREAETFYCKHFRLPIDRIVVVSYDDLSSKRQADILFEEMPDLVVADEMHNLRDRGSERSARTRRFLDFFNQHPECRFAGLTGTPGNRSPIEYAHLVELALRKNSPMPRGYREIRDWAGAIAVKPEYRMRPGVLRQLCREGEDVRSGFRRRLIETKGIVATSESAIGTSLLIRKLTLKVPLCIRELRAEVAKKWSIDGEEFESAAVKAKVLRELSAGFHYRWVWPDDEPDVEWLDARAAWHKELRHKLRYARRGMDSPKLLEEAAERFRLWHEAGCPRPKPERSWDSKTWAAWRLVKHRPQPPKVAVWHSDFVVDACLAWAKKQTEPAIIWYGSVALGERIASKGKLPLYDAGTDAGESTSNVIVASIAAQGTGKNLQRFSRNLLGSVPPNGKTFEQLAGRTHRPGQEADTVIIDWLGHTPELEDSMAQIIEDAEYQEETTGQRQKVLYADRVNE